MARHQTPTRRRLKLRHIAVLFVGASVAAVVIVRSRQLRASEREFEATYGRDRDG